MSRSKDKGTLAETGLATYLRHNGWPHAERRALTGANDKGDITGTPGLAWEVKYAGKSLRMAEWLQETVDERANAGALHGILVIKPPGYGLKSVDQWFAAMIQWDFTVLLAGNDNMPVVNDYESFYAQDRMRGQLTLATGQTCVLCNEVPVLKLRPRGQAQSENNWYRVTTVSNMVWLLRSAGFGDPLEVASTSAMV